MKRAILAGLLAATFAAPAIADQKEDAATVLANLRFSVAHCPDFEKKVPGARLVLELNEKAFVEKHGGGASLEELEPQIAKATALFDEVLTADGSGNPKIFNSGCKIAEEVVGRWRDTLKRTVDGFTGSIK